MSTLYRRNPAIEAAPMQGESILFDPATNRFCLLNDTAAAVWERLASPATVEQLSAELLLHFETPAPALVEQDVRAALQQFAELAFVATEPAS
ncbi:MAG: PqqD family protein [Gemmatimonadales bacterium]|nr:MAG: PqqD family protein [Gemmatimonadales bacterium]